ncbi:MAG TPA: helicase-associated domain-containing protein, partial [Candidatus Hydrogenedentes bacterium]|nr:helicase-associated domain-containing protein [Candidatus Hydrogenedentota bacterium]
NTSLASITEFGYHLISGKVPVSAEHAASPAELIVKPDFEVFVSLREGTPLVLPVLSVYGEVSGEGEHALLFRLTREKYLSALQQGYPDHFLVGFLERHARNNRIPDNVKRTLEDWDRTPRRVRLRRVTLVECDDPVLLAELTSYPELSGRILPTDPKHSLALRGLLSSEAKEILYRKGIIVEQTDPEKPDRI